jgi:glutathione synthase/RimK-type ligase-like ATP-grasp enzyme
MGSHGDSNYLIKDKDHAEKIIKEEPETEFVAQEYCPNDRDYRILIIGNKELIFERRGGVDTHLNNTSKGGLAKIAEDDLPKDIVSKARQLALGYNLTLSGVDTMPKLDSDEYYFLEINFQPQIATGVLLDEKKLLITELLKSLDKD